MPLTLEEYEKFVYDIPNRFPSVRYSTLVFVRLDPLTAVVRGEVFLEGDIYLRVREVLDFDSGFLQTYSYEVYRGDEQLYWYDDWSHPDIPELKPGHWKRSGHRCEGGHCWHQTPQR